MNNGRDCEHGSQLGKCYICDLVEAENRIAELEKEKSNRKGLWVTSKDLQVWKLEQQAKGVCDLAESMMFRGHLENTLDRTEVLVFAAELTKKAKALREISK